MPIPLVDSSVLGRMLRDWVSKGGNQRDAALIADVLGTAGTLTDVITRLRDQENCAPPRGFVVVSVGKSGHRVLDGCQRVVLRFSIMEQSDPDYSVVRIL